MALIKKTALISEISGKLQGSVFAPSKHGTILRNQPGTAKEKTSSSDNVKANVAFLGRYWRRLTEQQMNDWKRSATSIELTNRIGKVYNPSGYNYFQSVNLKRVNNGKDVILTPPEIKALPNASSIVGEWSDNFLLNQKTTNLVDVHETDQKLAFLLQSVISGRNVDINRVLVALIDSWQSYKESFERDSIIIDIKLDADSDVTCVCVGLNKDGELSWGTHDDEPNAIIDWIQLMETVGWINNCHWYKYSDVAYNDPYHYYEEYNDEGCEDIYGPMVGVSDDGTDTDLFFSINGVDFSRLNINELGDFKSSKNWLAQIVFNFPKSDNLYSIHRVVDISGKTTREDLRAVYLNQIVDSTTFMFLPSKIQDEGFTVYDKFMRPTEYGNGQVAYPNTKKVNFNTYATPHYIVSDLPSLGDNQFVKLYVGKPHPMGRTTQPQNTVALAYCNNAPYDPHNDPHSPCDGYHVECGDENSILFGSTVRDMFGSIPNNSTIDVYTTVLDTDTGQETKKKKKKKKRKRGRNVKFKSGVNLSGTVN